MKIIEIIGNGIKWLCRIEIEWFRIGVDDDTGQWQKLIDNHWRDLRDISRKFPHSPSNRTIWMAMDGVLSVCHHWTKLFGVPHCGFSVLLPSLWILVLWLTPILLIKRNWIMNAPKYELFGFQETTNDNGMENGFISGNMIVHSCRLNVLLTEVQTLCHRWQCNEWSPVGLFSVWTSTVCWSTNTTHGLNLCQFPSHPITSYHIISFIHSLCSVQFSIQVLRCLWDFSIDPVGALSMVTQWGNKFHIGEDE